MSCPWVLNDFFLKIKKLNLGTLSKPFKIAIFHALNEFKRPSNPVRLISVSLDGPMRNQNDVVTYKCKLKPTSVI